MTVYDNMALLSELFLCGSNIYTWCYDAEGRLLTSNCPEEKMLDTAFELFDCKQQILEYAVEHDNPISVGTAFGLRWGAAFEKENAAMVRFWVIGPFFYQDISEHGVREGLRYYKNLEISPAWKVRFPEALKTLPTVQNAMMARYILMLHYALTDVHLEISDIACPQPYAGDISNAGVPGEDYRDRHKTWMAEQALLEMVRTGNLNYTKAFSDSMAISSGVPVRGDDALRQAKTSIVVFTTLVTRAAIEGGLSPEEAYALGDSYMQSAESTHDFSDLDALSHSMYADFIGRVHKVKMRPDYSAQIRQCIDYIELHCDQRIKAADLASRVGYSEYYLTAKFKEETGISVSDYIMRTKVERAKLLLETTQLTAQEISEQLSFSSRNYFSRIFKKFTGVTPTQYRESDHGPNGSSSM